MKVENLKCGGCATTVTKSISALDGISNIVVNLEEGTVSYSSDEEHAEDLRMDVIKRLADAGYPIDGQGNNWQKAKSYISCAKGKFS